MSYKLCLTIAAGALALFGCTTVAQAVAPDGPILFTNVNVFDGVSEKLIWNAMVE